LKTFFDFFIALLSVSSYACDQLLLKIHEQEMEILDGILPALIPGFPFLGLSAELLAG
jgi:hypothetical protein